MPVIRAIVEGGSNDTLVDLSNYITQQQANAISGEALRLDLADPEQGSDLVSYQIAATGSVARSVQSKLGDIVNAEDFGAVGDGVSDDSDKINAAIDAVFAAGGGDVRLGPKRYAISAGILLKEGVTLRGAGMGSTELVLTGSPAAMIDALGSLGSPINVTATVQRFDKTLQLEDTSSLAVGDYLVLYDDLEYNPQAANYRAGEVVRVMSVDSATQVTLWSPVAGSMDASNDYDYDILNTPRVMKVNTVHAPGVDSMTITGNLEVITIGIRLFCCYAATVQNVHLRNFGSDGVRVNTCIDSAITKSVWQDMTDDIPGGHSGYGVHIINATDGLTISDCHFTRLRHGVTTGNTGSPGVADQPGIPHRIVVSNCTGKFTTAAPFDTHAAGDGILFSNCISYGSTTHGFSIRSVNTQMVGCLIYGYSQHGITLAESLCRNVSILNCTVRDAVPGTSGNGINNINNGVSGIRIQGCQISNVAQDGIMLCGDSTGVYITDNVISGVGSSQPNRFGIAANTSLGTGGWVVARNILSAESGSWANGISTNFIQNSYFFDNKARGVFSSSPYGLAANYNVRNDVLDSRVLTPPEITSDVANYQPAGYFSATEFRISSNAARILYGLAASGGNGRDILMFNIGGFTITLAHDSATAQAANRFMCPGSVNYSLAPNAGVRLTYDSISSRWRIVS